MAEKTASLTVLGGPLAGTRCVLPETGTVTIGSAPDSTLPLDLPTVSPFHARIEVEAGRVTVHDTGADRELHVNDNPLEPGGTVLRNGDILWLGVPGEDEVVMLQCILPRRPARGALSGHPARGAGAADVPTGPRDAHARRRDPGALVLRRGRLPRRPRRAWRPSPCARSRRGPRRRWRSSRRICSPARRRPPSPRRPRRSRRRRRKFGTGGDLRTTGGRRAGLRRAEPPRRDRGGDGRRRRGARHRGARGTRRAWSSSRTPRPSWSKRPRSTSRHHPRS